MLGIDTHRGSRDRRNATEGYQLSSESDSVDAFTEDLERIGSFSLDNLNQLKMYLNANRPNFQFPNMPTFEWPHINKFPKELSTYLAQYIRSGSQEESQETIDSGSGAGEDAVDTTNNDKTLDHETLVNSIKTAISSRVQMNTLLRDLQLGLSMNTAVERLQLLKDIVHQAILLPVDDSSDFEDDYLDLNGNGSVSKEPSRDEVYTEPVGVSEIVNKNQPIWNHIIDPNLRVPPRSRRHRHSARSSRIHSETEESAMDASDIEGLTTDEVKILTDLDSLDDFYKQDLLRKKIQKIQQLKSISQHLKNKLVTRLMMGNYYKYLNEKMEKKTGLKPFAIDRQDRLVLGVPDASETAPCLHEGANDEMDLDMTSRVGEEIKEVDEELSDEDEVVLTQEDLTPTYHDHDSKIMGCPHYQRNCKLECPTCYKWFTCRFCHDAAVEDHKLIRSEVKYVLCMNCNSPQVPELSYCIECGLEMANYFCKICVLYDNDPTKDIYHCDKCGICRLGLGLDKDYFHCDTCNICLSIDLKEKHRCIRDTTHSNCPICNEYLFTSISPVVFMKCGHSIHQNCYDEMSKHSYKCPICKKTVVNIESQFRILDQEIALQPLPDPYNKWRCIVSCNDCKGKSNVPYHVLGLRCKYCQSYNTNQLKLIKPEEEEDEDEEEEDDDQDKTREKAQTKGTSNRRSRGLSLSQGPNPLFNLDLVRTNLQSNFIIENNGPVEEGENGDTEMIEDEEEDDFWDDDNDMYTNRRNNPATDFKAFTNRLLSPANEGTTSDNWQIPNIKSMLQKFLNQQLIEGEDGSDQ